MGLTKEQEAGYRQSRVLKMLSRPGGCTGSQMARELRTTRGKILNDIRALRAEGYPIQASSMVAQDGMYQACFELLKKPSRKS